MPIRPTKKIKRTGPSAQIGMNAAGRTMLAPLHGMDARGRTVFHEPPPQYRQARIPYPYPAPHVAAPPPRAAYPNALTADREFQDLPQWQLHRVVTAYENEMSNRWLEAITARGTDYNGRTDEEKFQEMLAEYERRNRERGGNLQNASRNLQAAMDREVIYISSDSEDQDEGDLDDANSKSGGKTTLQGADGQLKDGDEGTANDANSAVDEDSETMSGGEVSAGPVCHR